MDACPAEEEEADNRDQDSERGENRPRQRLVEADVHYFPQWFVPHCPPILANPIEDNDGVIVGVAEDG